MPAGLRAALAVLVVALPGCAELTCAPATIVVDRKEERTRLDSEFRGVTTDPLGRVGEQRRDRLVAEYWVQDREGRWYRVPEAEWRAAEPGRPLQVCR
jgi:hypothetical protein